MSLGPSEDDTEYDGVFSYTTEYHAFQHGFAVGFASVIPDDNLQAFVHHSVGIDAESPTKAMQEARQESQYATGGVVGGILYGCLLLVLSRQFSVSGALRRRLKD